MPRIKELDYLRGLAALGIMLYHYFKWLYIYDGAQSVLGRLSVYGVEIFYILSGITLYHVYHQSLKFELKPLLIYGIKRCFRIFPLFWLCIFLSLLLGMKHTSIDVFALNVSGLFGFIAWEKYIAPGSWSIGNELVFYVIFPILFILYKLKSVYYYIVGLLLLFIFNYFAYQVFDINDTLHNQWKNFVNPLNHLFLFFVGMSIPILMKRNSKRNLLSGLLIISGTLLLFLYPSGTDGIHLLYGHHRWLFSIASIMICCGFYAINFNFSNQIHKPLKNLGEISYSIYLLHPFVYQLICMIFRKLIQAGVKIPPSNFLLISLAVIITLILSKVVYLYYETYFIKKGNTLGASFYKS